MRSALTSALQVIVPEVTHSLPSSTNSLTFLSSNPKASAVYNHLSTLHCTRVKTKIELDWERDLQVSWPISIWNNILLKIKKASRAANTLQTLFFIYNRLFFSPSFLHKINANSPHICWSCSSPDADLKHLLFFCPFVQLFGKKVWKQITQIFHHPAPFSFANIFLESLSDDWSTCPIPFRILDLLLGIMFQQITKHWKNLADLSFQAWWYSVCHNHRLDTVYVFPRSLAPKRLLLWSPITDFIDYNAKHSFARSVSNQEVLKPP